VKEFQRRRVDARALYIVGKTSRTGERAVGYNTADRIKYWGRLRNRKSFPSEQRSHQSVHR